MRKIQDGKKDGKNLNSGWKKGLRKFRMGKGWKILIQGGGKGWKNLDLGWEKDGKS